MSTPRFLELPPGVRREDVPTPHGTIAALWARPASGGCELRPAVLVPGYTGSKEDFLALLQTLAQAGREVIAIDLPGQYESSDAGTDFRLPALGSAVTDLIDSVDLGAVHLLGHSFGGLVARETVLADQVPLLSFTLMSSGPSAVGGPRAVSARNLIAALSVDPSAERVAEIWDEHMDAPARMSGIADEIHAFLRTRMLANNPRGLIHMAEEILSAPDRTMELASADVPLLVLYGENDDAWPPETQATMARHLGARRIVIPGAAHSPNVEAPETTASALTSFWNAAETPQRGM